MKEIKRRYLIDDPSEYFFVVIFDYETTIGLLWYLTVRDHFRHMWE